VFLINKMKNLSLLLLILISVACARGQTREFKVADFVEMLPGDSLKEYFLNTSLTTAECATFYRVGKIDSTGGNLVGLFHDNYMNGKCMFTARFERGMLTGPAKYYYSNGRIKEEGKYIRDKRAGIWKYYYDNGHLSAILHFLVDSAFVVQTYTRSGDVKVANGNGFYKNIYTPVLGVNYEVSGNLVNGKPDGEWKLDGGDYGTEQFNNGTLIKGQNASLKNYTDRSAIGFTNVCVNENLEAYENKVICPGWTLTWLSYSGKTLPEIFYPSLIGYIKKYSSPVNQWVMVGITFDKKAKDSVQVYSSIHDAVLEHYVAAYLSSLTLWSPTATKGKSGYQPLFFVIVLDNTLGDERVLIPAEFQLRQLRKSSPLFHNIK
jgi:hypothetical protein